MGDGNEYSTDVTGSLKDRYLERERRLAGLQKPLAREIALRGAPMETAEALASVMDEEGRVVTPSIATKKKSWTDRGAFGFLKRNVGEKVGYGLTQALPAWAELVTYAIGKGTIKAWIGDERWKQYQDVKRGEGQSFEDEVREYGMGEAMNRSIRRLASARDDRPGLFFAEKVLGEIVCDPTTYMGWGLMSRIPVAGKVLGPIMDVLPQQVWKQTFGQAGKFFRYSTTWEKATERYMFPLALFAKSPDTVIARHRDLTRAAFATTMGAEAMAAGDVKATKALTDVLIGIREAGGEVSPEVLRMAESTVGTNAITQETLDQLKMVAATLDDYAAKVADDTGEVVESWLAQMSTMTPKDATEFAAKAIGEATSAQYTGAMEAWHNSRHVVQRVVANIIQPPTDWMQHKFTRWAVLEPARAMLLFANYGPFNVLEDFVRTLGGGARPSLVNANVFDQIMMGVPVPEGFQFGKFAAGSEMGLALKSLGAAKVTDVPILAHMNIPGLKQVATAMTKWNTYFAEGGAMIRRGHFVSKYMEAMRQGAIVKGYASTVEYNTMRAATKFFPKIDSPLLNKEARKVVEALAEQGKGAQIRRLPQETFGTMRVSQAEAEQVVSQWFKDGNYVDRQWLLDEIKGGKVKNWSSLKATMKQRAVDHMHLNLETLDEATGVRLSAFREAFAAPDLTVDQAVKLLDDYAITAQQWTHMPTDMQSGLISISEGGFKTRAGAVSEMEWYGRIEGTRALVTKRLRDMSDLLDEAKGALGANKVIRKELKGRLEGHYTAFRDNLRRLRDDTELYHKNLTAIKEEFFPAGKGIGTGWKTYEAQFKRLVSGDGTALDELPKKLRNVITRGPIKEDKGFFQANGLSFANRKLTMKELQNAFYEAQKEAVNELTRAHVAKVGGTVRHTAQRRMTEKGYFMKSLTDSYKEMDITKRMAAGASPQQAVLNAMDDAAEAAQGQLTAVARQRQAANMMQATSHWSNLEHQIDTTFDELAKIGQRSAVSESDMAAFQAYCNRVASASDNMMANKNINYSVAENLRDSGKSAIEAVKNDFANYTDTTLMDQAMRMVNPFWIYQSRSWPWLAGQAVRHPGVGQSLRPHGRYWEVTEGGYIPTPVFGMQLSPMRGTVFNRLRRAFRGPYPQRYEGLMGALDNSVNKHMERYGFYPGLHLTVPLEMMTGLMSSGTRKDMMSAIVESMPSLPATALEGLIASSSVLPASFTIKLADELFPSKFREYYMAKALWDAHKVSASKAKELGHDDWIADAYRSVALANMAENQLSMARFNPESWQKIEEQKMKMIAEISGLTVEQQIKIKADGGRVSDHIALSRLDREKLRHIEGYEALTEGTRPLSEGLRQEYIQTLSDKYDMIEDVRQGLLQDQAADDWRLQQAWITADDWRENYYERWQEYRASLDNLVHSDYYGKLGRTVSEQKAIREKLQFTAGMVSPVDIVIDAMFSMEPEKDMFGNIDWQGLFDTQEQILATLDTETREQVQEYLNRNATPMMKKFREGREFMQGYWRADQALAKWYRKMGDEQLAHEMETLFPMVRQHQLEMQEALNQGLEYDIAKVNKYAGFTNRLTRHIAEIRWRMAYDPNFRVDDELQYDPRIADYLLAFYGAPPKEKLR